MKKTAIAETVESIGAAQDDSGAAGMSSEQAQDAAALAAMVADAGEPVTVTGEPVPEPPRMSAEESLAGLLSALPHILSFAGLKNTAAVWNEQTGKGLADRAVPVLRKYPWGVRVIDFLETGAGVEEMALAMFVLPVGIATVQAWKSDAAAIAAAREAQNSPPAGPDDSGADGNANG